MRKAARKAAEAARRAAPAAPKKRDESHYSKSSARMLLVSEADFFTGPHAGMPGLFFWKDIVREVDGRKYRCRGIFARYPDGSAAHLPVRPVPESMKDVNGGHSWGWDGNETSPTLTPSVHIYGSWHGWIRNGEMRSC